MSYGATVVAPVDVSEGSKDTIAEQLKAQGLSLPGVSSIVLVAVAVVVVLLVWKS